MAGLQFEHSLERRILSPSMRRRRRRPILPFLVGVAMVILVVAYGVWSWRQSRHAAVEVMSRGFLTALQQGELEQALRYCPESDEGLALLMADEQRVKRDPPVLPDAAALAEAREQRMAQLQALRREASDLGVNWDQVAPLAFAGVIAELFDETEMLHPVVSVTGFLCVEHEGKVYGLELTARECPQGYVVTGLWGWEDLGVEPKALRSFSNRRYEQFTAEQERRAEGVGVTAHRLYKRL